MYDLLKSQFEETKQTLSDVEKNIRRITGRDPDQFMITPTGNIKFRNEPGKGGNLQLRKRAANFQQKKAAAVKDAIKKAEEEEEEEEEEESPDEDGVPKKKPSLQSTIVANLKGVKTRRATMEEQKNDRKIFARNRRMFGVMLGTLQKFQSEESRRLEQARKRAEIDKKLEEAAEKEKLQMKKEKEQLFLMRREKQTQIRCLEKKLEIAEIHEVWKRNHNHLLNFIQTESSPKIMFLPAKHNDKSEKRLKESREKILAMMKSNTERVEKELAEIDELYRRDDGGAVSEDVGDKENIGPPENLPSKEGEHSIVNGENLVGTSDDVEERTQPGDESTASPVEMETDEIENPSETVDNPERTDAADEDSNSQETDKKLADQEEFEPIYDE